MRKIFLCAIVVIPLAFTTISAQIRISNLTTIGNAANSSAFFDASSSNAYNTSTNLGKGLLYPRTDLTTFTAFGGSPIGLPTSYPTYYDGLVVYNTATSGVAGVGATQGTLTAGFWYYDNKSTPANVNGGTWKPLAPATASSATEPWYNQANGAQATSNTQDIYQTGKVAINKTSTNKQLDVAGDFRTEYASGGRYNVIDTNPSIGNDGVTMFTADTNSRATATDINYVTLSQSLGSALGSGNVSGNTTASVLTHTIPSVSADANINAFTLGGEHNMIGVGSQPGGGQFVLSSVASKTAGNLETASIMLRHNNGIRFFYKKPDSSSEGDYTFPRTNGLANQVLTTDGSGFAATLSWKNVAPATTNDLSGSGNAYACINPAGQIFRSATPCTP